MITDPTKDVRRQPGYKEYRNAAGEPGKFPWKIMAQNMVLIPAGHLAGYYTGGALTRALAKSRIGARFARLPMGEQGNLLRQGLAAAGSIGAVAASLAHMSGQVRAAHEIARLDEEARRSSNEKVASLCSVYANALEMHSE